MSLQTSTTIRVIGTDAATAARAASSLRRHIIDADLGDVDVQLIKEDKNTQDGGATLILLLSAPVINTLAQGIADWIRKRRVDSTVELSVNGDSIKLSGDVADDPDKVRSLVAALQRKE